MKAIEFERWFEDKKNTIGMWGVEAQKKIVKEFTMGCYYDLDDHKWKVYANEERGQFVIYLETESEEEAFDELKAMVSFEQKNNKGYY